MSLYVSGSWPGLQKALITIIVICMYDLIFWFFQEKGSHTLLNKMLTVANLSYLYYKNCKYMWKQMHTRDEARNNTLVVIFQIQVDKNICTSRCISCLDHNHSHWYTGSCVAHSKFKIVDRGQRSELSLSKP